MELRWQHLSLFLLALSTPLLGADEEIAARENVWAVGLQVRPLHFSGSAEQRLEMTATTIDVSRVWVKRKWWASVDASLILGPWSQRRELSPPIDYSGSGLGARFAYALFSDGLRQPSGDWGLTLGAETMEVTGRSFRRENLATGSYTEGWLIRGRWTAILPGVFYSTLKPGRPKGNRPEWLTTRIEGYTFCLALALPVQGQIKQSFSLNGDAVRTSRKLEGYAIQLAFSTWLGI